VRALVGYGQYYGYVNYGYHGYGYGYGNQLSNYFDVKEKKGVIGFIKNIFGI
jgi:hypothetical protein